MKKTTGRSKHCNGFKEQPLPCERFPSYLAVPEHVSNTTTVITLECPIKGKAANYLALQEYTNKMNDFLIE